MFPEKIILPFLGVLISYTRVCLCNTFVQDNSYANDPRKSVHKCTIYTAVRFVRHTAAEEKSL